MSHWLDKLERVRGLPVLIGVALVVANLLVRCVLHAFTSGSDEAGFLMFLLTDGNLLLHLGIVVGLLGVLIGDVL